jgi:DNA topoisomerase I
MIIKYLKVTISFLNNSLFFVWMSGKYELIVCEKPSAAKKIADALADGKAIQKAEKGVNYYLVTHGNRDIVVASGVGHLYGLDEKEKGPWDYPVFDIEWKPNSSKKKNAFNTTKFITLLKKLGKDADEFTIATDYDVEGEVIGLNIMRFALKQKDANRMKFSTLTKGDLIKSYQSKSKNLNWGQANAGETRHFLDWMYGINLSRALTLSIKHVSRMHQVLSSGRVQGPALKIIVNREKDIKAFVPTPYWQIELNGTTKLKESLIAWHVKDKFWEKDESQKVMEKITGEKKGVVKEVKTREFKQEPPHPFDLTSLQMEAYRTLRIAPKRTLEIAQSLYVHGIISYPRTSSQKLPKELNLKGILEKLKNNPYYTKHCLEILKKPKIEPNEGKKTDPAHPAIHPTGEMGNLTEKDAALYELIVRRFLATFGDPAVRQTITAKIDVKEELFVIKGTTTVVKGWHELYGRFVMLKEEELPKFNEQDIIDITKFLMHDKETQPPKRYTPASIIKELEKRGLGTKSTRASIVDNLYQRGYVKEKSIEATNLGIRAVETLEKYCPDILDEELTREFELQMEKIRENKKTEEEVLEEVKKILTKILERFKKHEADIGKELAEATRETMKEMAYIGPCPVCKQGILEVRHGKFGQFIACDKYPDCKTTFSLPSGAGFKSAEKVCEACSYPMILVFKRGKRPQELCINPKCPTKALSGEEKEAAEKVEHEHIKCPKCSEGNLVLRKSIYGSFYGCSKYPKCKFTQNVNDDPTKTPVEKTKKTTKPKKTPTKKNTKKKPAAKKKSTKK